MEKKGRQIFSKIVQASKLTWLRTLQTNKVHLDMIIPPLTALEEVTKKTFFIHGELTETNKALLSFSDLGISLNFCCFLLNR